MKKKIRERKTDAVAEWKRNGMRCLVLCHHWTIETSLEDHFTAYVCVPKRHPFYGRSVTGPYDGENPIWKLEVHGGVTFADKLSGYRGWWIGFDTAHARDNPRDQNLAYVMEQVNSLADQIGTAYLVDKADLLTRHMTRGKDAPKEETKEAE